MSKFVDEAMSLALAVRYGARPDSLETLRAALIVREALLDRMAEALLGLKKSFPTEDDLHEAGWYQVDIDKACSAYDASYAVLTAYEGSKQ